MKRIIFHILFCITAMHVLAQEQFVEKPAKYITSFPFRQLTGGVMLIRARINNITDTFNFILDTVSAVHDINATHAREYEGVTKAAALDLLQRNASAAAAAIRALSDEALDNAAPVSLYADAPLTCQFFLEDHAVRHSYHHLARIRAALEARAA